MSLRIRRGTDEQRQGVVFDSGELVVTTDQFKLFVGDGATAGGRNIATNLAGNGLTYNSTTQALDLDLNITTDDVPQGINNKYFSNELAQDAIGAALVAGNSTNTGISFVYSSSQDTANKINAIVSLNLNSLSDVIIDSTPANGQVLKYNATQGAWVPALDSGGGGGAGLSALEDDLNPTLGGDLALNGYNITGLGNINTTGTLYSSLGLGGDLNLNDNDITGNGNISVSGTLYAENGLSGDLGLNGHNITGNGNISTSGTLYAETGLGGNLGLNSHNITGIGNVNITGTINATSGLGGTLNLNNQIISGTGDINITGYTHVSSVSDQYALFGATQENDSIAPLVSYYRRKRPDTNNNGKLQTNDGIANLVSYGFDGTSYVQSSAIQTRATGTVSTGIVPGQIELHTADAAGVLTRRFLVDNSGITSVSGRLVVSDYTYNSTSLATFVQAHDTVDARPVLISRARGTASAPTAVLLNDTIGKIVFNGYTGSTYTLGATILVQADGAIGTQVPTRVSISTSNGTSTAAKLTVYSTGLVGFNSPELVAGSGSGEVNTASVATYMKVKINGVDYAIPAYNINP